MRTLLSASIHTLLLCTAATVAGAAEPVSLEELMTAAGRIELRQGHTDEEESPVGTMRKYRNGDELIAASGVPIVLGLCRGSGGSNAGEHLNLGAMLPALAPMLSTHQRTGAIADIYLRLILRAATVLDIVRDGLPLPPPGESAAVRRTTSSGNGDEQYTVTVDNGFGGGVRVKVVKTGTALRASEHEAEAGRGDGSAAWLSAVDPVGTWHEVVVSSAPQEAALPGGMSMKGWLSPNQAQYLSVGQARRASSSCTPSGDASVDQSP